MMWLRSKSGIYIVIHTANLIPDDWKHRTQGIYISPLLKISDSVENGPDSSTKFRRDLLEYFETYDEGIRSSLKDWIKYFTKADFSPIEVHLVASVPRRLTGPSKNKFGHLKLSALISGRYGPTIDALDKWSLIGQFSSIGTLGENPVKWLKGEFVKSLTSKSSTGLKLIYPTVLNVRFSYEGYKAGTCLPYSQKLDLKQKWLRTFLYSWQSLNGRTRAIPHIKSYALVDPESKKCAWFLLTSSNLSKAAWGCFEKQQQQFLMRSYEIGVLFFPKENEYFTIDNGKGTNGFKLPFEIPLTKYSEEDEPWIVDKNYEEEDSLGGQWLYHK